MRTGFPVSVWDRPFGDRTPGEYLEEMRAEAARRAERRRVAAAIRRDQDARASRPSVDTAELARRRDALVANSSWNQVRRQGRR
jgi:hypothetical protein